MQDEQSGQMTIFDFIYPKKPEKYIITKKVRLIELFAGIGSQAAALKRLGVEFEHYKVVEFDKFAIASYNAVHGTCFETSDITQIHADDLEIKDTDKYEYIMTYSFPCQDLSLAGKQKGMAKGSGTRSGLLWEVERLLDECEELPQVLLMENVPQVIGKKNVEDFKQWQTKLESLGYSNFVELLNAKNYGIPQNRNRCFMVSILGNYKYEFPKPFELKIRLKDILEDEVDEKYYLSERCLKGFLKHNENHEAKGTGFKWKPRKLDGIASCIRANGALAHTDNTIIEPKINHIGNLNLGNNESNNRVYSPEGLSPTLNTMQGGHRQPKIMVREATKKGYAEAGIGDSINLEQPNSKTRRGRVGKGVAQTLTTSCNQAIVEPLICASRGRNPDNPSSRKAGDHTEQRIEVNTKGLSNTLTTVQKDNLVIEPNFEEMLKGTNYARNFGSKGKVCKEDEICGTLQAAMGSGGGNIPLTYNNFRIRKLTPLECWRLMGFDDESFYKAEKVNSNTQLYKQAGNSIVVNVLYYIFKNLFY